MRIAIYPGSFNPVHQAHVLLAEHLIKMQLVDQVWFLVTPCNPLKERSDLIDEYLRLDMASIAIKGKEGIVVSDFEFSLPAPNYTLNTLQSLTKTFPDHIFSLLIGSDNAVIFDQWKSYETLLNNFQVFVYPRKGYDFSTVADQYPRMQLLDTPVYDVSSTKIRTSLRNRKYMTKWMHPEVLQYIREKKLYRK